MCGIFGWSFPRKSRISDGQREAMASALACLNAERGRDSWGVAAINKDRSFKIVKGLGSIVRAGGLAEFGRLPVVLGHTRAATVGAVTQRNAHPFETNKIILAHNGAVYNHADLNKKYERKCEVDSEHLIHHISEGKEMKEIEGYGSIEYLVKGGGAIMAPRLARLRNGSLSVRGIRGTGGKAGVVWSSSDYHLRQALDLAGMDHFAYKDPPEGVVHFAESGRFFVDEKAAKIEIGSGFQGGSYASRGGRVYRGGSWSDYEEGVGEFGLGGYYGHRGHYSGATPKEEGGWSGRDSTYCSQCTHYHDDNTGACNKVKPTVCMCPHVPWAYERKMRDAEREAKKESKNGNGHSKSAIIMLPQASTVQGVVISNRGNILHHPDLGDLAEVGNGVYCRSNGEVIELDAAEIAGLRQMEIGG